MIRNYLKVAFRNLWKNKVLSFINISGLALGMAGAVLLLLNIQYDLSVDQFHEKKNLIYKAYNKGVVDGRLQCWDVTAAPLAPALKQDYPEIKQVARISGTEKLLSYGEKKLKAEGNYTDPSFLDMFSFPLVRGNVQTALKDIHSIVITEKLSKKIFGDEDPMNKVIVADNKNRFMVTGVVKDLPANTQFKFEYLIPWEFLHAEGIENAYWNNEYAGTFVELHSNADINSVNNKISDVALSHSNKGRDIRVFLHPLSKLHIYGRFENGKAVGGDNIRFLGILAIVVLLIACINFMNLSTARSEKRAKEVGVRKVVGAAKRSLIFQFIGESVLLSLIAGVIALSLVEMSLPVFSALAKAPLAIPYQSPFFWLAGVCLVLFTGILAGSYPAFYLSSFKPVKVLKGVLKNGNALVTPRKILVVLQFVFSIFLINFTIIFQKQIAYGQSRDTGFVKENLIFHPLTDDLRKNYKLVKDELLNGGTAISVSGSNTPITGGGTRIGGLNWEGMDLNANVNFELFTTQGGFVKTNGLKLISGRDIDVESYPTDTASCMINEAALKVLGFKNPIGQTIKDVDVNLKVVGVIKDFLIGGPGQPMSPVLIMGTNSASFISIRLNSTASLRNVKDAEGILKKYNRNYLTEVQFADDEYAAKFKQAKNVAVLINSFALIAIFISCMGLFGLATYMAENRTKEIGIRKVLGASVAGITSLLAKDFIKLVIIAIVIASPLAWLFINFFLQQFAYRTTISSWIFLAAGASALLIALFTISFQSIKAAVANPVMSLRTE